jgi:PKD repeat protein
VVSMFAALGAPREPPRPQLGRGTSSTHPGIPPSPRVVLAPAPRPTTTHPARVGFGWTNLTFGSAPSVREGFGLAYDGFDHYVVLFGGYQGSGTAGKYLNDTWKYLAGNWTNITGDVGPSPPARDSMAMTYDPADGYVLMTGGYGPSPGGNHSVQTFSDTWSFSSGRWRQVNTSWPSVLANPCRGLTAAYDSTAAIVIVLDPCSGFSTGGVAVGFKNGTWTDLTVNATTNASIPTPGFVDPVLVDEPALGGVVFFGGSDGFNHAAYNETILYAGGNWTDVTALLNGTPPGRDFGLGDFDHAYPGFLLWGGDISVPPLESTNQTWILHNRTWLPLSGGPAPRSSLGRMVWDGADNSSIEFSGFPYNETWSWGQTPPIVGLSIRSSSDPVDLSGVTTFSATFLGGLAPYNYTWSFGDGSGSSAASPSHAYSTLGTYPVALQMRDSAGHSSNASLAISVATALVASIRVTPNLVEVGSPVEYVATLTGGSGSAYNWTFGDGLNSSSQAVQPNHSYGNVGNYSVHLTATDAGGTSAQATATVRVVSRLSPPIVTANPSSPELGQLVNFTATETTGIFPLEYSWAFGDGGTGGNLSSISHIFTTNGPFVVSVSVLDAQFVRASGTLNVTIALNISALGNWSAGAAPLAVGFHSSVVGGVPGYQYDWTFGDGGSSAAAAPTHDFVVPGLFTTLVRVQDNRGNTAESAWTVFVGPSGGGPLVVSLTAQPSHVGSGGMAVVTASISGGVGGFSLHWGNPGLLCAASGPLTQKCTGSEAGTFVVTLSVGDQAGHSSQVSTQVIVGGTLGTSGPPPGAEVNWTDVGLIAAAAGGVALVALAVESRRRAQAPREGGRASDPFAEYRSVAPGSAQAERGALPVRKAPLVPSTAAASETEPAVDPLSDLE